MQICASAPVLRPLLAKIPFSLSETLSRGMSIKKSTEYASNARTPDVSRTAATVSATSSTRRAEVLRSVPELANDKGRSYEMKHWDDAERRIMGDDDVERGSQEAILENEAGAQPKQNVARLWDKIRKRESEISRKEDMTITRTSEVELQIGPASGHNSKRSSRHQPQRTSSIPPLRPPIPSLRSKYSS